MNEKEALTRVKTGNFNSGRGFDMQLLVDAVGIIGEMFKSGQVSEIIRCKDCKQLDTSPTVVHWGCGRCKKFDMYPSEDWFCADGEKDRD